MIIASAAHFVVCNCEKHGRLVAANGEETRELCSKEDARRALDTGVKKGWITSDEVPEATRQIDKSPLPDRGEDVTLEDSLRANLVTVSDMFEKSQDENILQHFHNESEVVH